MALQSIPLYIQYLQKIRLNKLAFLQITDNVFALLDLEREKHKCQLSSKYVIVERCPGQDVTNDFYGDADRAPDVYNCSCDIVNCLHIQEVSTLAPPYIESLADNTDIFEYAPLTENLIGIYAGQSSYGILKLTRSRITCLKCIKNVTSCVHTKAYREYIPTSQLNIRPPPTFKSVSINK